ncbi:hypothetical protein [Paenarthrobacter ilicis]|uniref:Uncharacterized protein n=1 Tax=Paenarthrobacter ilicis TaxID=43665 RepID=A0ABX0TFF4_9MICC|nr:hypothetical protein [Paenarthrobacter ilicis]MBM7793736.1 hypothetical protein [Paenarthrobacter ilicis]NII99915.1 hypothetical protein [Paenarthrobacter ilicis]
MKSMTVWSTSTHAALLRCTSWLLTVAGSVSPVDADHRERGDVPGWVMITLMSAVLVAGLLAIAAPALEDLFNQAIDKVAK